MYLVVDVYYVFTFIGYFKYLTFPRVKKHKLPTVVTCSDLLGE